MQIPLTKAAEPNGRTGGWLLPKRRQNLERHALDPAGIGGVLKMEEKILDLEP
jgi:hypothetical protein